MSPPAHAPEAQLESARRLFDAERWVEAIAALRRVSVLRPADPVPHRLVGQASARIADWEASAHGFAKTVELGAASVHDWVGLGDALAALDRLDSALKAYGAALGLEPDSADTHLKMASALVRLGRTDEALSQYARAVEIEPDHAAAHAEESRLLCDLGRWDAAVVAAKRAVELSPETPEYHHRLACAYAGAGDVDLAMAAAERVVARAPEWSEPRRLLMEIGNVAASRGRWGDAAACYSAWLAGRSDEKAFEDYFGGMASTKILEFISSIEHTPAYVALAELLEAEGRSVEARFVRAGIERLQSESGSRGGPESRRLAARVLDGKRGDRVPIPRKGPDGVPYATDKISHTPECLDIFEEVFAPFVEEPIVMLELGVYEGGSLLMWRDYFRNGTIVGLDVKPVNIDDATGRIRLYEGYQEDLDLLDRIAREIAPEGLDIIIDDASHRGDITRITFNHAFDELLRPGGVYVIEDWQSGYLPDWPDGKAYEPQADILEPTKTGISKRRLPSHDFGMVGFVKQLLDRTNDFERVLVSGNRVFVMKRSH